MAIVTRTGAVLGAAAFSTYPHTTAFQGNTAVDRCNNDGFLYAARFPFSASGITKSVLNSKKLNVDSKLQPSILQTKSSFIARRRHQKMIAFWIMLNSVQKREP